MVLQPNSDWWALDTCHLTVSDVQVSHAVMMTHSACVLTTMDVVKQPAHLCCSVSEATPMKMRTAYMHHE